MRESWEERELAEGGIQRDMVTAPEPLLLSHFGYGSLAETPSRSLGLI